MSMQIKLKYIVFCLFLIDALLLIINIEYRDPFSSVIPDLDRAEIYFYLGTLSFIIQLVLILTKKPLKVLVLISSFFLAISMFFNVHLAKENYDRIQCNNEISEYFEYGECLEMEERFEIDLNQGEIKYFQFKYAADEELVKAIKKRNDIKLVGLDCTFYVSMQCYNELVIEYLERKNQ